MLSTDFWWLLPEEARQYGYVDIFHQEPYSDEPNTDRGPLSYPMLRSERRYSLESISQWTVKSRNINVFRSLSLYSADTNGQQILGPFLLDIDRILKQGGAYVADIGRALKDTRLLVKKYCSNLKDEDYRIFFTGHKGFHLEIDPRAINIPPNVDRQQHFENRLKDINKRFGDAFVDKLHHHVRLHNSINRWIDYSGRTVSTMNFELSIRELFSLNEKDIFTKAENLALGT